MTFLWTNSRRSDVRCPSPDLPLHFGRPTTPGGDTLPKFLFQATYNAEGSKGVLKEGGSSRRAAVEQLVKGLGGKLEALDFAFRDVEAFVIADLPENVDAVSVALAGNASGVMQIKTTVLLTPEQMDVATKRAANFRPPGR